MNPKKILTAAALTTGLLYASSAMQAQQGPPPPPPGAYQNGPGGGWDAPPPEFQEMQRQGFHDGIEGARKDFDNHRRPNVNNRDEFKHPHVERAFRRDYRDGFRRGYDVAVNHLYGPNPHY